MLLINTKHLLALCGTQNFVTAPAFCVNQTTFVTLELDYICSAEILDNYLNNGIPSYFTWEYSLTPTPFNWVQFNGPTIHTNYTIQYGQSNFLTESFNSASYSIPAGVIYFRVTWGTTPPAWTDQVFTLNPVPVINFQPTGTLLPPYDFCSNTNIPLFFQANEPLNTYDYQNSTLDFGDGNGPQQLTLSMMQDLTNPATGLSAPWTNAGTYTVSIHLVNGCGFIDLQQTYTVHDQINLSANDFTICEGTTGNIDLSVNAPAGMVFEWFESINQNPIGTGNPLSIPAPQNASSYYAVPQPLNLYACASPIPVNLSVTIAQPQPIVVSGPLELCGKNPFLYSIVNPFPGVQYNWTTNDGLPGTSTGTQLNLFWNDLTQGGTFTVTANGLSCLSQAEVTAVPCCNTQTEFALYLSGTTAISNIIQAGDIINQNWMNLGPYTNFIVDGELVIDVPVTFSGITMEFMAGSSMRIEPNFTAVISDGAVLKSACNEMWNGIYLYDPSSGLRVNTESVIQDAIIGVHAFACATLDLNSAYFNKNLFCMVYESCQQVAPVSISHVDFFCEPSATSPGNTLLAPYLNEYSYCGIYADANAEITIGDASAQTLHNEFRNMAYGIVSHYSNIAIYNNEFLYIDKITPPVDPQHFLPHRNACLDGTAICISGETRNPQESWAGTYNAIIGATGVNEGNNIEHANLGIRTLNNVNATIVNNDISFIHTSGIYCGNKDYTEVTHYIEENRLQDAGEDYIKIMNAPLSTTTVINNKINFGGTAVQTTNTTGILISEGQPTSYHTTVEGNLIFQVRTGIECNYRSRLNIENNYVEPVAQNWGVYGAGIRLSDCNGQHVRDNSIVGISRNNWWVDGIRISNSVINEIHCNYMYKTGSGLFFDGNCGPTKVYANNMRRNYWGMVLNWGVIGDQLIDNGTEYASDNIWVGDYTTPDPGHTGNYWHTNTWFSDPTLSKVRVRNNVGTPYLPQPFWATTDIAAPNSSQILSPDFGNPPNGTIPYQDQSNLDYPFYEYTCNNVNATNTNDFAPNPEEEYYSALMGSGGADSSALLWWMKYEALKQYFDAAPNEIPSGLIGIIDSMKTAASGQLFMLQFAMSDSLGLDNARLSNLQSGLNSIATTLVQESVWKNALSMQLQYEAERRDSLNVNPGSSLSMPLYQLASECPINLGPGVYMARHLYKLIASSSEQFWNACEKIGSGANERRNTSPFPEYIAPGEEEDMNWEAKAIQALQPNFYASKLVPNPASETTALIANDIITYFEVLDLSGRIVDSGVNTSVKLTIPVGQLVNGSYLVMVHKGNGSREVVKLEVQH